MDDNVPEPVLLPPAAEIISPEAVRASFWAANRRRPAFLALLVIGLVSFLIWLPAGARASLWVGLNAQRGLVILLSLFALVTLSLVWTAGLRAVYEWHRHQRCMAELGHDQRRQW